MELVDGVEYNLDRRQGHLYIDIPVLYEGQEEENEDDKITFIMDTGAFLTVISRNTAIEFGFDKLPVICHWKLSGFGKNKLLSDIIRIPAIRLAGKVLIGAIVAVPFDIKNGNQVLGLNILNYFEYSVKASNNSAYFRYDADYKHGYSDYLADSGISVSLACNDIFTLDNYSYNNTGSIPNTRAVAQLRLDIVDRMWASGEPVEKIGRYVGINEDAVRVLVGVPNEHRDTSNIVSDDAITKNGNEDVGVSHMVGFEKKPNKFS
ncbi:hypothetical protein AGMMS49975_20610 [Clostridia bacterium]|nr:hypothetical protein AGMMS49975_20610 [Clostridia bacterium]